MGWVVLGVKYMLTCMGHRRLLHKECHNHRRRNRGGTGGMCPPNFHRLLYKLLTTLCVISTGPPPNQKVFSTPMWGVGYVVGGCNVVAILSMSYMARLDRIQKLWEYMSWVCMVCWSNWERHGLSFM